MPLQYVDEQDNFYTDNWYDHPSQSQLYGLGALGFSLKPPKVIKRIVTPPPVIRKIQQQIHMPKAITQTAAGKYITKKAGEWERAAGRQLVKAKRVLTLSNWQKFRAYAYTGNIIGAYMIAKAHPDDIIPHLPKYIQDYIGSLKADMLSEGERGGLGLGYIGWFGDDLGAYGLGSFSSNFKAAKKKIAQSWDQLPHRTKNIIITIIIAIVIVVAVLIWIGAGAAAPKAGGEGAKQAASEAAKAPVKEGGKQLTQGGWLSKFGQFFKDIIAGVKGNHDVAVEAGEVPPPPAPPTSEETAGVKPSGGAVIPLAAAAALLLL